MRRVKRYNPQMDADGRRIGCTRRFTARIVQGKARVNRLWFVACALLIATAAWPQGFHLESDRVAVDEGDWAEWEVAAGTVQFGPEGVRPHRIREQINAVLDAPELCVRRRCAGRSPGRGH